MQQNQNLAYDFSKFEETEPRRAPQLKVLPAQKPKNRAAGFKKFCLAALLVGMISLIIYNQVVLTELTAEIGDYNRTLTQLQTENTRLNAKLGSTSSMRTLEEYAQAQYGLGKLESNQVIYINLCEDDRIEITDKGQQQTGAEKISDTAGEIMEYLKLK